MSGFKRLLYILYFIVSVLGLGVLFCLALPVPAVADMLAGISDMAWFPYALYACVGVCAIGLVVILIRALTAPRQKDRLCVKNEFGKFDIERKALISVVRSTLGRHTDIEYLRAHVSIRKPRNPQIRVRAKLAAHGVAHLAGLAEQLQEETKNTLENFTGTEVRRVDIKFTHKGREDEAVPVDTTSYFKPGMAIQEPGTEYKEPADEKLTDEKTESGKPVDDKLVDEKPESERSVDDKAERDKPADEKAGGEPVSSVVEAASELVNAARAAGKQG